MTAIGDGVTLHLGDCLDVMRTLPENSVDTVITDPPYGLSFMGKNWDHGIPGEAFWREALRVARPGAMLLAFGGTRTHHRLMVAIEDAGWQIRDCVFWIFGSGFPKSHDHAKAIQGLFLQEFLTDVRHLKDTCEGSQVDYSCSCRQCGESLHGALNTAQDAGPLLDDAPKHSRLYEPLKQTLEGNECICTAFSSGLFFHLSKLDCQDRITAAAWQLILEVSFSLCRPCFEQLVGGGSDREGHQDDIDWSNIDSYGAVCGWATSDKFFHTVRMSPKPYSHYITTADNFTGYGTALKPAAEVICLAMAPLSSTFAANALEHGVAGLNVDGGRIGTSDRILSHGNTTTFGNNSSGTYKATGREYSVNTGRWPANVILDPEAAAALDEMSGERVSGGSIPANTELKGNIKFISSKLVSGGNKWDGYSDSGGASRFFYCAKSSRAERNAGLEGMAEKAKPSGGHGHEELDPISIAMGSTRKSANHHPTVKPLALMRYLCKLTATPTGGVVLDPFCGSGTTGMAAAQVGRGFIGIELDPEYFEIAKRRIVWAAGHLPTDEAGEVDENAPGEVQARLL